MFSDNMNRKILTLMLCMGLITIGASSAMGLKLNNSRNMTNPLLKFAMLTSSEEDYGVATGGFLYSDSYEIEILDGNYLQVKKIERLLEKDSAVAFNFMYLKNMDLKITYKKTIADPENSTEFYLTFLYLKEDIELVGGIEVAGQAHTLIIKGFNGWFLRSAGTEEAETDSMFIFGGYESQEILLVD
jgi:hypothetical protein